MASSAAPNGGERRAIEQTIGVVLQDQLSAGYVRAGVDEPVIEVMGKLLDMGRGAAALVFEADGRLSGIFTERDYLKVKNLVPAAPTAEDAIEVEVEGIISTTALDEDMAKLVTKVGDWMTPVGSIISTTPTASVQEALQTMRDSSIRHLVVRKDSSSLQDPGSLLGVVYVGSLVSLIQSEDISVVQRTLSLRQIQGAKATLLELQSRQRDLANQAALESGNEDLKRTALLSMALAGTVLVLQGEWLHDHWQLAMWSVFALGYSGIIFEEVFEFNKAAIGLIMAGLLWIIYSDFDNVIAGKASTEILGQLGEKLAEVSDICFFILAASTIVEVMDAHQGFRVVTKLLETDNKQRLFVNISVITFFLSAVLNNLTVTIVMVSLLRKLVPNEQERHLFGAMVVIAANAGGVWTPIGDVTTTMLWINENLSTVPIVTNLFFPSLVTLAASTAVLLPSVSPDVHVSAAATASGGAKKEESQLAPRGKVVFTVGILALLSVPVFNEFTGLPPYLGMLCGLGVVWLLTDVLHAGSKERAPLRVPAALEKLDTAGILFFFGVLLSVGALESSGQLKALAQWLSATVPNLDLIATLIGLASAVVDNVPLVAATMGMYDTTQFPMDDQLWQLIAYCAGTGGSILVIGSASGVALMGLEKVEFLWYLKNASLAAFVGYVAGIGAYLAEKAVLAGLDGAAMGGIFAS